MYPVHLRRYRNHILISALSFYTLYKLRKKLESLINTISILTSAASSSADSINLLSNDLNTFLRSKSDAIPNTLNQLVKLARSNEFSSTVSRISEAATVGVVKGIVSESLKSSLFKDKDKVIDKLFFSEAGSGLVSVVVGSFAKNLVLGFYSVENDKSGSWVDLVCDDKCRVLVSDCIQVFVRNAVTVYLDKTKDVNLYDDFLSGLTSRKHEGKVKDVLVSVCNGAVETFIKTSHQILTNSNQEDRQLMRKRESSDERIKEIGRWVNHVSSTLAVPSNRRLVLDLTGRVTFETVKSFLEFVMWKSYNGVRRGASVVRGEVSDRGLDVVRYCSARSMIVAAVCVTLCMHVLARMKGLDSNLTQHLTM